VGVSCDHATGGYQTIAVPQSATATHTVARFKDFPTLRDHRCGDATLVHQPGTAECLSFMGDPPAESCLGVRRAGPQNR